MSKIEQASNLIGDIYDAALDPALWPEVLHTTCDFVKGCAATLVSEHSALQSARFFSQWGTDPYYTKLYQEKYVKMNPALVPLVMTSKPGQITSMLDFVPRGEYLSSKFYKEWAQPQGYLDAVNCIIEKSAFSYGAMAVARNKRSTTSRSPPWSR